MVKNSQVLSKVVRAAWGFCCADNESLIGLINYLSFLNVYQLIIKTKSTFQP